VRKTNDLGRDPVFRLVCRLAIPTMLAQLVSVLYSIVDRIYIGNIQGIGDLALAGVGVCGPIVTLLSSFASLVGLGGSLDVFAGVVERAPEGFQKLGLEWLYRLVKEPKRIGRMAKLPLVLVQAAGARLRGK